MKILYLSCHSILEYDEVKLLTELGHEVYSVNGSYSNPTSPVDTKRPAIVAPFIQHLNSVAIQSSKENLHDELIDWADLIIIMHKPEWILGNWKNMRHKMIVWRTIGQSVPAIEDTLAFCRQNDMRIIRYSPAEDKIKGFIGHDAVIRFYKDPVEYKGWNGKVKSVLSVAQSMKQRSRYCGYELLKQATVGLPVALHGTPSRNADGSLMDDSLWKGELTYPQLKKSYRDHRVYFYTGTYPASYTLNFIEAMMTGIPIVAIGKELANLKDFQMDSYEVSDIIENGKNGFVSNDIEELKGHLKLLLEDEVLAKKIGDAGRKTAIKLFGKSSVKKQWKEFLESL